MVANLWQAVFTAVEPLAGEKIGFHHGVHDIMADDIPIPRIGLGAVVFNGEGQVLLIRRGKAPALGLWSVPGGCLEPGETMMEGCRREVLEETGLDICVGPIIAVAERVIEGFHYVILDFAAVLQANDTPPIAADDASEARWVALEALQSLQLVEGLRDVVDAARRWHGGKGCGLMDENGDGRDFLAV